MQLCTADVRIGGSVQHVVPKQDLTPAEIIILRKLHGEDAVVNIRPTKMDKRSHADEYDRLSRRYGKAGQLSVEGQPSVLIDRLFPGAMKKLPITLADIGMGHLTNPRKAAAAAAQEEANGSEDSSEGEGAEEAGSSQAPSEADA